MKPLPLVTLLAVLLAVLAQPALGQTGKDGAAGADRPVAETAEPSAEPSNEGEAEEEAEPEEDRITFDVRLAPESGGGRVKGSAGAFEFQEGEYLIATDGVTLEYQDLTLTADRARVDVPTSVLTAEGSIVLDEGPRRITGETLEYDLEARTGRLTDATAYVAPDYYFRGSEIAKVGAETYTISDGVFTSCEGEDPSWQIALSSASVTLEEYARIRNARMKFGGIPVFYVPYVLWPAKTERTSGFLVPQPGYSRLRGASLSLGYFQTLGRSADATFYADLYSDEFFGFGTEFRYRPSERTQGILRGYMLDEPDDVDLTEFGEIIDPNREAGDLRWKINYFHETKKLWNDRFRFVVQFEDYSDFDFLQDYERNVSRQTRSFIYSTAFMSGSWGQQSLNFLVDQRERIARSGAEDTRRQLPEIEYKLRPTQLGSTPIYLSLLSSAHYFDVELTDSSIDYGRVDIFPTISAPLSTLSWLSAKLDVGGRVTHYTDSLTEDRSGFSGESLTRVFPTASLEVVGPSFSRIFDKEIGRFAKFKHIIEPRLDYTFVDTFDDQDRISLFDEVDNLRPANGFLFSFTNRLLAKPKDESQGGAFEIASFTLAQGYSFDDDQPGQRSRTDTALSTQESPIFASLRINPSQETSVEADVTYNTLFDQVESLSFSGGSRLGRHSLGLTLFTRWNAESGDKTSDQARLFTSLALVPEKLTLDAQLSYDLRLSELLQQRYFFTWRSQCYGIQLELRESTFGDVTERDYRFSLTLKNVGTFLDLTGGFDSF